MPDASVLGQLLRLGDSALRQELDILLLTLGDGGPGGHNLVLGHVDHGVHLHQVGLVLQGDEVGGLVRDVQQQGEGGNIAQVLDHALGGYFGRLLGGAGSVIELGLLGALVAEQEAQVGLVRVGGGDAGIHVHIVVDGDIVVALSGNGPRPAGPERS